MTRASFIILFSCLTGIIYSCMITENRNSIQPKQDYIKDKLKVKADSAKIFCTREGLNTEYCILVDMSLHSGRNRFFVWNFSRDTVLYTSLCCHGYGKNSTEHTPVFSNVSGSYCTSLGKYKIGARSYSNWGINVHYKLHGLESSNSKAYERIIVLHSHSPVPDREIYPDHLPLGYSQGCPVISNELMTILDKKFKGTKKPVLLWIFT